MYSFFALSGTPGARAAAVAAGSLIITLAVMGTFVTPASPFATLTIGALA